MGSDGGDGGDEVPTQVESTRERIDAKCDAFEAAWRQGLQPSIDAFLKDFSDDEANALFEELLLLDVECRRLFSQPLTHAQYLHDNPWYADEIQAVHFAVGLSGQAELDLTAHTVSFDDAGNHVAHFELIEKIGEGNAGQVWRARDTRLQRLVALKLPLSVRTDDADRFLREGRAAAQLNHANIVRVYDVGRFKGVTYIASDYIHGANLRRWMSGRQVWPTTAAEICIELADGLQHAHERGIVHRDLKPANVIISHEGKVLIADFGLAKRLTDNKVDTLHGQLLGTLAYMSPEQASGRASRADRRSDIYSLGVILYELLCGECPHQGEFPGILNSIIHDEPKPIKVASGHAPQDLESICLKCLNKLPDDRYQTAAAVADDLRRFSALKPVDVAPPFKVIKASWGGRSRRAIAIGAGLATMAAIALFSIGPFAKTSALTSEHRVVHIATEPADASITMVRLDPVTGEPIAAEATHLQRPTPLKHSIPPGDYLVVAVLPDGRFHEVLRHVPGDDEQSRGAYNHLFWREKQNGDVVLPRIKIPSRDILPRMQSIPGWFRTPSKDHTTGEGDVATDSMYTGPGFYVDLAEFTYKDFCHFFASPLRKRWKENPPAPGEPLQVSFDEAVQIAEKIGKRLPTELEMLYAISNSQAEKKDRRIGDRNVLALIDGVAEWTTSGASSPVSVAPAKLKRSDEFRGHDELDLPNLRPREYRVVVGEGQGKSSKEPRFIDSVEDDGLQHVVSRFCTIKGIGFRCVRSPFPRFQKSASAGQGLAAKVGWFSRSPDAVASR